eukprot:868873-Prorocentrum_minimum.AAC.1
MDSLCTSLDIAFLMSAHPRRTNQMQEAQLHIEPPRALDQNETGTSTAAVVGWEHLTNRRLGLDTDTRYPQIFGGRVEFSSGGVAK